MRTINYFINKIASILNHLLKCFKSFVEKYKLLKNKNIKLIDCNNHFFGLVYYSTILKDQTFALSVIVEH